MRILVLGLGSDGDVNPVLEIAKELKLRGHEIHFFANGHFKEKVDLAGFEFVELGSAELYQEVLKNKDLWDPRKGFQTIWDSMKGYLEDQYSVLEERLDKGNTSIVSTTLGFAARFIQEKHGVKLTSVHLQPSLLLSSYKPPYMPGFKLPDWFPVWLNASIIGLIDTCFLDRVLKNDINDLRAKIGLKPVKNIMTKWIHSPDQVLLTFPDWFASPQPDWPKNTVFSGFPVFPSQPGEKISDKVLNFLESGEPPIVITAGSANAHSKEFFESGLDAVNELGKRAVLVSKFVNQIPESKSENIIYSSYEPFDLLFPKASCVVHHGGIGTSAQCLLAATPQLVVPFAHDQFDNANRLEGLDVGLHAKSTNKNEWISHLSKLTGDTGYKERCLEMSNRMISSEAACKLAAEKIEALGC